MWVVRLKQIGITDVYMYTRKYNKVHRYLVVVTWGGVLVSEVVPDESVNFNNVPTMK